MNHLPWTNEDISRSLTPGAAVSVSLRGFEDPADNHTRDLTVLGIEERDLMLVWPENTGPLPPLGSPLVVSMLRRGPDGLQRYGFDTNVIDTTDPADSEALDPRGLVVVLPRPRDVVPLNLRTHRRFVVRGFENLKIDLPGLEPTTPLDLCWEGLRFCQGPPIKPLQKGQAMDITLMIYETPFSVQCQVMRVIEAGAKQHVSVKFPTLPLNLRAALADLFLRLEPLQGSLEPMQ